LKGAGGCDQFSINPSDIVIYRFIPATAGDAANPAGAPGYFEFRVTPPETYASAYSSGTITPTPFDITSNDELRMTNYELKAYAQNGVLHVTGLTPGQTWRVYSITGTQVYSAIATAARAEIPLPARGICLVTTGTQTVKVIIN
jgi:hypothetical protein